MNVYIIVYTNRFCHFYFMNVIVHHIIVELGLTLNHLGNLIKDHDNQW